jgi:hypothetical protein
MGLAATQGQIPSGSGVQIGSFTTQTDVKNTWPDGSLKFAIVSADATSTGAKTITAITNPGGSHTPTWPTVTVDFVIGASTYTATLGSFSGTDTWLNGAVVREARKIIVPDNGGTPHGLLEVIFDVRSYAAGGHKIFVTAQNAKNTASMDQIDYDVEITVGGVSAYTKSAHRHHSGQRWTVPVTSSLTEAAVTMDFEPFIDARLLPRFYSTVEDTTQATSGAEWDIGGDGIMNPDQYSGGYRRELSPYTEWHASFIVHQDSTMREAIIKHGYLAGSWPLALSVAGTDGVSFNKVTDNGTFRFDPALSPGTNSGVNWPTSGSNFRGLPLTINSNPFGNFKPSNEHLLNLSYVPYIVTGDRVHVDNLKYWAAWAIYNYSSTNPNYKETTYLGATTFNRSRGGTLGRMWPSGLTRELGHPLLVLAKAGIIVPDADTTDQAYFREIMQNNLDALGTYATSIALAGGITEAMGWEDFGGIGNYSNVDTGLAAARYTSWWRLSYTAQAIDVAAQHPDIWTVGDAAEFRDRVTRGIIGMLLNLTGNMRVPSYPMIALDTGSELVFASTWAAFEADNLTDPSPSADPKTGVTITRSGSTATITYTGLNFKDNQYITVTGANQSEYNVTNVQFSRLSADSGTYTVSGTPTTPATGTITASPIGWWQSGNDSPPAGFHGPEVHMALVTGIRVGLTNAQEAYDVLLGISGMEADLNARCGYGFTYDP